MNIGRIETFQIEPYLTLAKMLCDADEPERALIVLEQLPAHYRDHLPVEIVKLRGKISGAMITAHAYMSCDLDAKVDVEQGTSLLNGLLRGKLLKAEVEGLQGIEFSPHIVDVGPGEYWALLGLDAEKLRFTYEDVSMLKRTGKQAWEMVSREGIARHVWPKWRGKEEIYFPKIFVALEIIEHLPSPLDLRIEALRHCGEWPEHVHLSTPMYTYDGAKKEWDKPCGLPHLRAYTPQEFIDAAKSIFPGYRWDFYGSQIMSLRGTRADLEHRPLHIEGL